jgi:hypothetical protein
MMQFAEYDFEQLVGYNFYETRPTTLSKASAFHYLHLQCLYIDMPFINKFLFVSGKKKKL